MERIFNNGSEFERSRKGDAIDPSLGLIKSLIGMERFYNWFAIRLARRIIKGGIFFLHIGGEPGGGKSVFARQAITQLRKEPLILALLGRAGLPIIHSVYDEHRRVINTWEGVSWEKPSSVSSLSGASSVMWNAVLREARAKSRVMSLRSDSKPFLRAFTEWTTEDEVMRPEDIIHGPVLVVTEAPLAPPSLDLGWTTISRLFEISSNRPDEEHAVVMIIPGNDIRERSDVLRRKALLEDPKQYAQTLKKEGVHPPFRIRSQKSLIKFRESMGSEEINRIVRRALNEAACEYWLHPDTKLKHFPRLYTPQELDQHQYHRFQAYSGYFESLFIGQLGMSETNFLAAGNLELVRTPISYREHS